MPRLRLFYLIPLLLSVTVQAEFTFTQTDGKLSLHENGKPVFVYNFGMVDPPEGVDEKYRRSGYLHPVYGLDGQVVTQDFPGDHYHHRGVYWGWPKAASDGRTFDNWEMVTSKHYFERWGERNTSRKQASFRMQNRWAFADAPNTPIIRETVTITAHRASRKSRSIDFHLSMENVSGKPFTFLGADNKGYGGFNFRPDANNKPLHFYTALGPQKEDTLNVDSPWADVSWAAKEGQTAAGVAIFQHPANPDYPHYGWLLRHYGFNGAAWPHLNTYTLPTGETLVLQYRLVIHEGDAESAKIAKNFKKFTRRANK